MAEHPIQGLMKATLESLKEMIDVNTVVGDPVETQEGQVIIPVSRVTVGFAAGGSEFAPAGRPAGYGDQDEGGSGMPFGGGSGAGVSVQPVGFLVVSQDDIRMLPVHGRPGLDRLVDLAPQMLEKVAATRRQQPQQASGGSQAGDGGGGAEPERSRRRAARLERLARRVTDTLDDGEDPYR